MQPIKISIDQARQIVINCQLLHSPNGESGKAAAAKTIDQLGYIQIDTIHVIERAHHHALWSRQPDYQPEYLDELLSTDRKVFEFWTHAAAYIPAGDYRYYQPKMQRFADPHSKWEKERLANFGHLMEPVLERIRSEGPLSVRDFEAPSGGDKNRWGGRKPEKVALEMLLWRGDLMVTRREKFHRIYDLTERVLSPGIDTSYPTDKEVGRFQVKRSLQTLGLATTKEIRANLQVAEDRIVLDTIKTMATAGEIVACAIEGLTDNYWALPQTPDNLNQPINEAKVRLLSPFDNLIIQRDRVKKLFDFDYALECYVQAAKRKWGYFVVSILWGNRLVGRFDPKADRKQKELIINSLNFEPEFSEVVEILPTLAKKLQQMARFNGCEKVRIVSSKYVKSLRRYLL